MVFILPLRLRAGALALALAAVAFLHPAGARAATDTIQVGTAGNDSSAQAFFATDLGFFKNAGLDAHTLIVPRGTGPAIISAVVGGSLDAGQADMIALAQAHDHGIPIVIVAPSVEYDSKAATTSLVVPKDGPIHSARDLNGKTIGILSLSGPTNAAVMAWIEQNGGDLSTVKFVELANAQMGASLKSGIIAAAAIAEPALSATLQLGETRILANPYDSVAKTFQLSAWFMSKSWADAHPNLVRKFVDVMHQTAVWANNPANHARSAEMLARYIKLPAATINHSVRAKFGLTFSIPEAQPIIDVASKYKFVQNTMPIASMLSPLALKP
jgi:NitT/TauT family transport system substrate-binding protein